MLDKLLILLGIISLDKHWELWYNPLVTMRKDVACIKSDGIQGKSVSSILSVQKMSVIVLLMITPITTIGKIMEIFICVISAVIIQASIICRIAMTDHLIVERKK